tara:strand:- start:283 stop:480 length:198 start_codon:yes stop_codon:yes gene_type:complete
VSPSLIIVAPQFVQTLNLDLKELIPKKAKIINNMGVKNNKIKILPNKLNKKLNPKNKIIRKEKIL